MARTVSKLADGSILCKWEYYKNRDGHKIKGITPHYMAGSLSGADCARWLQSNNLENSANYCIGIEGDCYCNVTEENGPWTSNSYSNDCTHITVEIANLEGGVIPQKALEKFKQLSTDIALRYGIKAYEYTGKPGANFTLHRMFAATPCPGDWFCAHIPEILADINSRIAAGNIYGVKNGFYTENGNIYYYVNGKRQTGWLEVNKHHYFAGADGIIRRGWLKIGGKSYYAKKSNGRLLTGWQTIKGKTYYFKKYKLWRLENCKKTIGGKRYEFDVNGVCKNPPDDKYPSVPFAAKVMIDDLNIREKASTGSAVSGTCPPGIYTITKVKGDFGKLKSGAGWIYIGNKDWIKILK